MAVSKAQDLVREAEEAGNVIAIQASLSAENVITAAQAQYQNILNGTMENWGKKRISS